MRVLMISADRGLFGEGIGDAVERHQRYADLAGTLDVIVVGKGQKVFKGISSNLQVYLTNTSKVFHLWGVIKIAKRLFASERYDLVVAQDLASPAGYMINKRYGVPLLVSVHSMFFKKGLFSFNLVNQWGVSRIKKAIKKADGVRVHSDSLKRVFISMGVTSPILVQSTPVNIDKFTVLNKERNSIPQVLYVGRLSSEKNVEMLIGAFKDMSEDAQLIIVGDGAERNRLQKLAQDDSRISFAGAQPYAKLPDFYKKSDIFVLPSNSESFGKVLIEAAASQCAIVATRTAGAESILTHEKDALLVPVGDKEALQMELESLIHAVDLQETLGQQALETARKYSFEEGCKRIVEFWEEIVNKHK